MNEYYSDKLNIDRLNVNKPIISKKNVSIRNLVMMCVIFTIMIMGSSCAKVAMPEELISEVKGKSEYSDIIRFLAEEEKIITIAVDQEKSSFREVNLLGDDDKEVVVLAKYKNSLDEFDTEYELQIYKYKNDRWNKLTTAAVGNAGGEKNKSISTVEFVDITADGYPEIFVISADEETGENMFKVYSYHGGFFQNLYSDVIGDYEIFDINSDDKQEIILIKNEEDYNFIKVLAFDEFKLTEAYREEIDMYANSLRIKAGNIDTERTGIYIYGENRYFSEDLIFMIYDSETKGEGNKEVNENNKKNGNTMIFNRIPVEKSEELVNIISVEDANGDGILDIGCLRQSAELYDYENKIEGLQEYVTKSLRIWFTYNIEGNYSIIKREYVNKEFNFKIILPNKLRSNVAIVEEKGQDEDKNNMENQDGSEWENKISFYDIANKTPQKILSIVVHKNEEYNEKNSEIIKLGNNQLYYYSASIAKSVYDNGDLSEEYIKEIFRIIDRKGAEIDEE